MAEDKNFKYIVRLANTDLDGNRPLGIALKKVKGIGFSLSNYICRKSNLSPTMKTGTLSDDQIQKIHDFISKISTFLPEYMINRRKDGEDGQDKHLVSTELLVVRDTELRQMKKIKSYRGVRHISGLPVRGQRTKSNFRRNKGKGLGVAKPKTGKKQ